MGMSFEAFNASLAVLAQGADEDLNNLYIRNGIIRLFCRQFDAACDLFRSMLRQDGDAPTVMGTAKEVIMAAYDSYSFVEEDVWLAMLEDRAGRNRQEPDSAVVWRIFSVYVPALQLLAAEATKKMYD
ncbi:nucleotidyltransferase substrate binding protein [Megasphaera vaginalis (ex Bordigoni et al. 2020)]|uniref:nucleotidyltransferase substrate binding protein n=1 Tax=Megasphaera vaginalis (ex Bordigoni et al. 2020) TaxID=2045301 RepID=UPI000C7BD7CD|nr:nucleotidyltransferase substrate binding protein [Megasphaera vaginalis (ex Bordigoni et al. 2020)]